MDFWTVKIVMAYTFQTCLNYTVHKVFLLEFDHDMPTKCPLHQHQPCSQAMDSLVRKQPDIINQQGLLQTLLWISYNSTDSPKAKRKQITLSFSIKKDCPSNAICLSNKLSQKRNAKAVNYDNSVCCASFFAECMYNISRRSQSIALSAIIEM